MFSHSLSSGLIDLSSDGHIHTAFCNHAHGEMEEYVQAALHRGLRRITFLEHLEAGIRSDHRTWLRAEDFDEYFRIGERLTAAYRDRLTIRLGVEVGCNPRAMDALRDMLVRYPFAEVGLSCHFYLAGEHHLNVVSRRPEPLSRLAAIGANRVRDAYFSALLRGLEELPCTRICHLDAVLRHLAGHPPLEGSDPRINKVLDAMRKKGVALEINTSGFAIRGEPYPSGSIVCRAVQLGISLQAGSDAHRPDQVGRYFNDLPVWLEHSFTSEKTFSSPGDVRNL